MAKVAFREKVSPLRVLAYYLLIIGILILYSVGFIAHKIDEKPLAIVEFYRTATTANHAEHASTRHHGAESRDHSAAATPHYHRALEAAPQRVVNASATKVQPKVDAVTSSTWESSHTRGTTQSTNASRDGITFETFPNLFSSDTSRQNFTIR